MGLFKRQPVLREELREKTELKTEIIQENELKLEPRVNRELKHVVVNLRKGRMCYAACPSGSREICVHNVNVNCLLIQQN